MKILIRNSPNDQWQEVDIAESEKINSSPYVDASGCTALTELKADAADYVYASGCTALTELKADAADRILLIDNTSALITDLHPWRQEMAECERIFNEVSPQIGDWCAWLHHEIQYEKLAEPWKNRLNYIAEDKPEEGKAWRFRMMRPVGGQIPDTIVRSK